jgi:restriction system protein
MERSSIYSPTAKIARYARFASSSRSVSTSSRQTLNRSYQAAARSCSTTESAGQRPTCSSAGALERPKRSVYRITPRGLALRTQHPDGFDDAVLAQFPEFQEFLARGSGSARKARQPAGAEPEGASAPEATIRTAADTDEATPREQIESAYAQLYAALEDELLEQVRAQSPDFFEQLVLDVLGAMGYGGNLDDARTRLGRSGDEGLDGVIREDPLGLDRIYVQAKRWQDSVGRPVVQAFVGALQGARASKGVLISTASFTAEAQRYAESIGVRVILIDGRQLASLMIEHNVGVSIARRYDLKRVDIDYFSTDDAS